MIFLVWDQSKTHKNTLRYPQRVLRLIDGSNQSFDSIIYTSEWVDNHSYDRYAMATAIQRRISYVSDLIRFIFIYS